MSLRHHTHKGGAAPAPLRWVVFLLLAMVPGLAAHAEPARRSARAISSSPANSLAVNTTADNADGDTSSFSSLRNQPGADGAISLREALLAANSMPASTQPLTITFAIPKNDSGHSTLGNRDVWTISVGSNDGTILPPLAHDHVLIDGSASPSGTSYPSIVLDGWSAWDPTSIDGLIITSAGNVVRGLVIANFFNNGIAITGNTSSQNQIAGCYIGTNAGGLQAQPNGTGVALINGAHDNTIGGATLDDRNVISGNAGDPGDAGIRIYGATTTSNTVTGNWIGVDSTGRAALANAGAGIYIAGGAHDNLVGGSASAAGNLIAGNNGDTVSGGVWIEGPTTASNKVAGNRIGVDVTGQAALGNTTAGVYITGGAHDNLIGGAGQGNLISGNQSGIYIWGGVANRVLGNTVGLAADGTSPLGNYDVGIYLVDGARDNIVGGTSAAARNIISSNGLGNTSFGHGIYVYGGDTTNNTIQGNYIGVDASGNSPAGNRGYGILVTLHANSNTIGGTDAGAGNVIAYNGFGGISLVSDSNLAAGNIIGAGADGATGLGNQSSGVRIFGSNNFIGPNNRILHNQQSGIALSGTNTTIFSNTIDYNAYSGICVAGPGAKIRYNRIANNGGLTSALGDCGIQGGIVITGTGNTEVFSNTIWGNQNTGITVRAGIDNRISANSISGNGAEGIELLEGGNGNMAPPANLYANPSLVSGYSCPGCRVEIFTDSDGEGLNYISATVALPSGFFSVPLRPGVLKPPYVTATSTDASGNTSPFTPPTPVKAEPPPPTQYKTYLPILRMR